MKLRVVGIILVLISGSWLGWKLYQKYHYIPTSYDHLIDRLRPLHTELGDPKDGDWLDAHSEPGDTFQDYIRSNPVLPTKIRSKIYIQPLGPFSPEAQKILQLTTEYMKHYFNLDIIVNPNIPLSIIPEDAKRIHPSQGQLQLLTTYILMDLLKPKLPENAAAMIAFTTTDLWPGKGWNFVFGQATIRDRVGVWSMNRNGDPKIDYKTVLMRTIKTAVHETGHMFSMYHCTKYECGMCGSNHQKESDRHPVYLCPECVGKLWWGFKMDPVKRYRNLMQFWEKQGFRKEANFFARSIKALTIF